MSPLSLTTIPCKAIFDIWSSATVTHQSQQQTKMWIYDTHVPDAKTTHEAFSPVEPNEGYSAWTNRNIDNNNVKFCILESKNKCSFKSCTAAKSCQGHAFLFLVNLCSQGPNGGKKQIVSGC